MKNHSKKNRGTIKLAIFLALGLCLSWSVIAAENIKTGDFARGSKSWADNCARCHNMRSPTDLRDDQWVSSVFHMRVRAGLTGQETRDIVTFLQGSNSREVNNSNVIDNANTKSVKTSGKRIYENNCIACHGARGEGSIPGVPDFSDPEGRLKKNGDEILSHVINGFQSPGSLMPMPPRGGNSALTESDIEAALDYIRSLVAGKGL